MNYSCSLRGNCEQDEYGEYKNESDCYEECQGRGDVDTLYMTYSYAPGEASYLAPSDRVRVIRDITGIIVDPRNSRDILQALNESEDQDDDNLYKLLSFPEIYDYIWNRYSDYDLENAVLNYRTFGINIPYSYEFLDLVISVLKNGDEKDRWMQKTNGSFVNYVINTLPQYTIKSTLFDLDGLRLLRDNGFAFFHFINDLMNIPPGPERDIITFNLIDVYPKSTGAIRRVLEMGIGR